MCTSVPSVPEPLLWEPKASPHQMGCVIPGACSETAELQEHYVYLQRVRGFLSYQNETKFLPSLYRYLNVGPDMCEERYSFYLDIKVCQSLFPSVLQRSHQFSSQSTLESPLYEFISGFTGVYICIVANRQGLQAIQRITWNTRIKRFNYINKMNK